MDGPIGVFDSGLGGLTVTRVLLERLPAEDLLYLGDTARIPYGPRPEAEVRGFVLEVVDFMAARRAKALVIACNTATAAGLEAARATAPFPVLGVIEPGARAAAAATRGRVGLLATEGTVRSGAYQRLLERMVPGVTVVAQACPRFTPLVEEGLSDEAAVRAAVGEYLAPVRAAGVDTVILGCTHYPILAPWIAAYLGPGVALVDPAQLTVSDLVQVLEERGRLRPAGGVGRREFLTTGAAEKFAALAGMVLGRPGLTAARVRLGR